MKIKFIVLGIVVLLVGAWFVASNLQLEETTISARYEMLACEDCKHMTVEKSEEQNLIGETIIPMSSTLDVEQLIDGVALTKEPLCLRGRPYRFNLNLWGIDPGGIRFNVIEKVGSDICANM